MPRDVRASSSVKKVSGSSTTPLPTTHTAPWMIPDGIWCSTNSPAPVSTVWPALAPPWYRTTRSARSARTSTIFPLPSSPHWAPTTTTQCVFGPNIDPQQKRPEEAGRWSILWGKLGRLKRACNSHTHLARALQRQPLRGIVGRVDDSRGGPVASHDRHALPGRRAERDAIDEHGQPAPAARVRGARDCVNGRPGPMHERNCAAAVVDAVEVQDRSIGEQVGPFSHDRPRPDEAVP